MNTSIEFTPKVKSLKICTCEVTSAEPFQNSESKFH